MTPEVDATLTTKWHLAALSMGQFSLLSFTVFRTFRAHLSLRTFVPLLYHLFNHLRSPSRDIENGFPL